MQASTRAPCRGAWRHPLDGMGAPAAPPPPGWWLAGAAACMRPALLDPWPASLPTAGGGTPRPLSSPPSPPTPAAAHPHCTRPPRPHRLYPPPGTAVAAARCMRVYHARTAHVPALAPCLLYCTRARVWLGQAQGAAGGAGPADGRDGGAGGAAQAQRNGHAGEGAGGRGRRLGAWRVERSMQRRGPRGHAGGGGRGGGEVGSAFGRKEVAVRSAPVPPARGPRPRGPRPLALGPCLRPPYRHSKETQTHVLCLASRRRHPHRTRQPQHPGFAVTQLHPTLPLPHPRPHPLLPLHERQFQESVGQRGRVLDSTEASLTASADAAKANAARAKEQLKRCVCGHIMCCVCRVGGGGEGEGAGGGRPGSVPLLRNLRVKTWTVREGRASTCWHCMAAGAADHD